MPRPSTIDTLPSDILEQLQALLRDPRVTQLQATAEINKILAAQGEEAVSKSAVNRYSQRMEKVGARLRESREIAGMWVGKFGAEPQGEIGKMLNEIIRTMAYETTMHMAEADEPTSPKMLAQLALAVQRLESSATDNLKRDAEIKRQTAEDLAKAAENTATNGSITSDQLRDIIKQAYGG